MKINKIMLFFLTALILSVFTRTLQLIYVVEEKTGFFKSQYEILGSGILIFIFAVLIISSFFGFAAHTRPQNPPESNLFLNIVSILFSVVIIIHTLMPTPIMYLRPWQFILLKILGVAAFLYFLLFGLQILNKIPFSKYFTVVPAFYLIIRIICDFTTISSISLISDNIILITAYCSGLWFMLQFAKINNNALSDSGFKSVLASGLLSSGLCLTQSIPHFIADLITGYNYSHTSFEENLVIGIMGIFILTYTCLYFSCKKNCDF